jgi:hypothetical protein
MVSPMDSAELFDKVQQMLSQAVRMPCWYVSAGKGTGSSFQLVLGGKVLRKHPIKNPHQSEEFRKYAGEASLLVWCSWRLDGESEALASSDEADEVIEHKLQVLVGTTLETVEITSRAWDLCLSFSGNLQLCVFCDHVPGDPSFDGNWQYSIHGQGISAGPGFRSEEYADEA